jgi:rhamnulokinase
MGTGSPGMKAHLAVDLGAESGRVFLGYRQSEVLFVREIHRFANGPVAIGKTSHWDVESLWAEVRHAMSSPELPAIASIGVDAWGVDYALLDEKGELLQNPYHYRDPRNLSAMDEVLRLISKEEIFGQTGAQFLPINTLYQLYAAKRDDPALLASARRLIMIPDLFHYWLSGNAISEYTVASTTQFCNPVTRSWATDLLEKLELPEQLPAPIVEPGTIVGDVLPHLLKGAKVVAPASHDTASAVAAISATGATAFLSSGTWSLLGIELDAPIVSQEAMRMNFTNEGGVAGTTRLLKNVMGLWMLQACRGTWTAQGRRYSYDELIQAATDAPAFQQLVDPDHQSFLNPADMVDAIGLFCKKSGQRGPDSAGACVRTILESLALKYRAVIRDLENLIGRQIECIHVMGGGSKNHLLNQFTADATGKKVLAGPIEASAIGNLGVQMVATGELASISEMRTMIARSFAIKAFEPENTESWNRHADRFQQYCR